MDCNINRGTGQYNPPLSTRLNTYGQYFIVDGDFGDTFAVLINWDSKALLYVVDDEGNMSFIYQYESVVELMRNNPGFAILSPDNANERYLPPLIAADYSHKAAIPTQKHRTI